MKKFFAIIMAILMFVSCAALAEDNGNVMSECRLIDGETYYIDLDGDGTDETVRVDINTDEESYIESAVLTVNDDVTYEDYLFGVQTFVYDIDGDGVYEIFMTGDEMSDDYVTVCLHYADGDLTKLKFADISRGENTDGLVDYGYGTIVYMGPGALSLAGSQDVLGTYFVSRAFTLENGAFVIVDDGMYRCTFDREDPDIWEYLAMTPNYDIPAVYMTGDNMGDGVIPAGTRFVITGFEKIGAVEFMTENGDVGYFHVEPSEEGWGVTIDGIEENDMFDYIRYAD